MIAIYCFNWSLVYYDYFAIILNERNGTWRVTFCFVLFCFHTIHSPLAIFLYALLDEDWLLP